METNQTENSLDKYIEQFKDERQEWTELVKNIAKRIKDIDKLEEVQIDLYSYRQVGVDYVQNLNVTFVKVKIKYEHNWKKAYDNLSQNEDYRYGEKEKSRFATEKVSGLKIYLDIVQIQIDFFKETIKTIDNMIFGIKHRIEIEDFKRGNK